MCPRERKGCGRERENEVGRGEESDMRDTHNVEEERERERDTLQCDDKLIAGSYPTTAKL